MTNNHLLIYRLAELMLEKQQHVLALDDLFEDEQIGAFVRSIQIDSPYQQLIFEGVLTETIKEERVMITFTVEGYFHYVLGEVIEQQTESKGAEALKHLLENNKLIGITEGVEQSLVRDVEKNNLSRLIWLIDEGGQALEASAYPLAQAFLIHPIERVMDELLADPTDNDIKVLEKAIAKLQHSNLERVIKKLYKVVNLKITPNEIKKTKLYLKSLSYLTDERILKSLKILSEHERSLPKKTNIDIVNYYYYIGHVHMQRSNFKEANKSFLKELEHIEKLTNNKKILKARWHNSQGLLNGKKGENKKAIKHFNISLRNRKLIYGEFHYETYSVVNNLCKIYSDSGKINLALSKLKVYELYHESKLGKYHPDSASFYNNYGYLLDISSKKNEALLFYSKALKIREKIFNENHPHIAITLNNIGACLIDKNKFDEAKMYFEKSLKIYSFIYNKNHPEIARQYNNLSIVYQNLNLFDQALTYSFKALKIMKTSLGETHFSTAMILNTIADCQIKMGKIEKSIKNYKKAHEIFRSKLGEDHQHTKLLSKKLKDLNDQ